MLDDKSYLLAPEYTLTIRNHTGQETVLSSKTQESKLCLLSERYDSIYFGCMLLAECCSRRGWSTSLLWDSKCTRALSTEFLLMDSNWLTAIHI